MPAVDLAAIRARRDRWEALSSGSTPLDIAAQTEVDTLANYAIRDDVPALLIELGRRNAVIRTLTSERDGLLRDRDCYRSAWRVLKGLPPLPGFESSPLDPVPPRVVGVLDETHEWAPVVRPPEPRNPTPAPTD